MILFWWVEWLYVLYTFFVFCVVVVCSCCCRSYVNPITRNTKCYAQTTRSVLTVKTWYSNIKAKNLNNRKESENLYAYCARFETSEKGKNSYCAKSARRVRGAFTIAYFDEINSCVNLSFGAVKNLFDRFNNTINIKYMIFFVSMFDIEIQFSSSIHFICGFICGVPFGVHVLISVNVHDYQQRPTAATKKLITKM